MEGVGGCVIVPLLRTISMVLHVSYKEVPLCTCMHIHNYVYVPCNLRNFEIASRKPSATIYKLCKAPCNL